MDLETLHSMRLRMDDREYYTHLTTGKLVAELNYHFKETLTDLVIMNIEDMRTFYLNRCDAIVSVLFERQPKEDLEHILQVQQELESALI